MRKIHITRLATVAGVTGAIAVAAIAFASGEKPAPQAAVAAPVAKTQPGARFVTAPAEMIAKYDRVSTQSSAAVSAYIDPDTKQLRSATQAELDAAAAKPASGKSASFSNAAVTAAPVSVKLANGATAVVLDDSYLSYAVATIGADGKVKADCVEQQPNAKAALRAAAALKGVDRHEK